MKSQKILNIAPVGRNDEINTKARKRYKKVFKIRYPKLVFF